jgi:hypothetical protein
MILANNHSTKLGTLNYSAHARTVRPTGADCPDRGPSGLRAGPSASAQFWFEQGANNAVLTMAYDLECVIWKRSNKKCMMVIERSIIRVYDLGLGLEMSQIEPGSTRLDVAWCSCEPSQARLGPVASLTERLSSLTTREPHTKSRLEYKLYIFLYIR